MSKNRGEIDIVTKINLKMYRGVYRELAEVVGHDAVVQIHQNFKGQQMSLPSKLLSTDYVREQITKEYNGRNGKDLAKKYDYTYSWIMKLVKKINGG